LDTMIRKTNLFERVRSALWILCGYLSVILVLEGCNEGGKNPPTLTPTPAQPPAAAGSPLQGDSGITGVSPDNRMEAIVVTGNKDFYAFHESAVKFWSKKYHVHWYRGDTISRQSVLDALAAIKAEHAQLGDNSEPEILLFNYLGHAGGRRGLGIALHPFYLHTELAADLHQTFESSIYLTFLDACVQGNAVDVFPISAAGFTPGRHGHIMTSSGFYGPHIDPDYSQCAPSGVWSVAVAKKLSEGGSIGDALDEGTKALTDEQFHGISPQSREYP